MAKKRIKSDTKMTPDELASLCGSLFFDAELVTTIAQERETGLNSYNSEPYGGEMSGLSKFVTSDVRDTIEWLLPQLIDIFYGSDVPVVFLPENKDDVDQAEIESKYCKNIIENQNPGFTIVYTWFKDALIQKNGIVKAWWDEKEVEEREEYKDKDQSEFMALDNDPEFEVDEVTVCLGEGEAYKEYSENEFIELMQAFTDPEALMQIQDAARFHVVGFRKRDVSQIRIEPIAPERFRISRTHKSPDPQGAHYCAEIYTRTRSELIEEGYDREMVNSLASNYDGLQDFNSENVNRYKKEGTPISAPVTLDHASDVLVLVDHYITVDFDGDGIAELRMVRTNGPGGEVLENEQVDRNIYHSLTPYINTHQFYGRSVADNMVDLQKLKTQVTRATLDSLTYSVTPRKKITGNVNISDLMSYIPGGIIRLGQNGAVENDITPFVGEGALAVLNFVDGQRAERTGFSRETVGLNPQALSNSTTVVGTMILNQSQLLTKMIASIFANTGFNSLMLHVRELAAKYEKKERIFDVAGEWIPVDPRAWRKNRSSTVKTGIGYAAKAERISVLMEFLGLQKEIAATAGSFDSPLTSPDGTYKLIDEIGKTSGVKDAMKYFRDPKTYQPPAPKPTLADATFKLQQEKISNDQIQAEAKKVTDAQEFKQKLDWEKEKFDEQMDFDREKFDREMLYKYGKDARDSIDELAKQSEDTEEKEPKQRKKAKEE